MAFRSLRRRPGVDVLLVCVCTFALVERLPAQIVDPSVYLTSINDVDKRPRADGDWIVWTRDGTTLGSMGEVLVLDLVSDEKTSLGAGFRPDVTIDPGTGLLPDGDVRVAFTRFATDGSLEVVSAVRRLGAWTSTVLVEGLTWVDGLRALGEHTVFTAPDAEGLLRVFDHDGVSLAALPSTRPAYRPELARLASGEIAMVWDETVGAGLSEVRFATWAQGLGWTMPETLPGSDGGQDFDPFVLADPAGGCWLAWQTRRGSDDSRVFVAHRAPDGSLSVPHSSPSFEEPGVVDLASVRSTQDPTLALDGAGRLWLFAIEKLQQGNALDRTLRFSYYDGASWTPVQNLSPNTLVEDWVAPVPQPDGLRLAYEITVISRRSTDIVLQSVHGSTPMLGLELDPWTGPAAPSAPLSTVALPTQRTLDVDGTTYELVFADLHSHTRQSPDAVGELDSAMSCARDLLGLDAVAVTDHDELLFHMYLDYEYELARRFIAMAATPTFTPFAGFEWTSRNTYYEGEIIGHRATFDSSHVYRSFDTNADELPEYYALMHQEDAIGVPHHLGKLGGATFKLHDQEVQPVTEISSVHGVYEKELVGKLVDGARFGIISAGDRHDATPGLSGLAGIWIDPSQTPRRDAIKSALRARRTFAARKDGAFLDVRLNGHLMGSELVHDGPLLLEYALDELALDVPFNVNVTRHGAYETPIYSRQYMPGETVSDVAVLPGVPVPTFYILRVTAGVGSAPDDTWLWSSPIWVDPRAKGPTAGVGSSAPDPGQLADVPGAPLVPGVGLPPELPATQPANERTPDANGPVLRVTEGDPIDFELVLPGRTSIADVTQLALHMRHDGGAWQHLRDEDVLGAFRLEPTDGGVVLVHDDLRLPPGTFEFIAAIESASGGCAVAELRCVVDPAAP